MSLFERIISFVKTHQIWVLLGLGLVVGLIFVFVVPPWMHYDEPGHLEYAWLIANEPGLPQRGDYDQRMRREISSSIIEYNIESYTKMTTDPLEIDRPIEIWPTHIGNHPPTYYILASIPLRLFRHSDITFQLYLMRLVSLSMFVMLIWVGQRASESLFGMEHRMTWMVPLFLVTLPSFVDIMTAANNDVLAILSFSLFFWASVEIIKKGFSLLRLMVVLGTAILCVFAKNTALLAAPLAFIVVLLAFFKGKRYQHYFWLALGLGLIIGLLLVFSWGESTPAFYYGADPVRLKDEEAPMGNSVIAQASQDRIGQRFFHLISEEDRNNISGQTATLGAWIWADAPTKLRFPGIQESLIIEPLLTSAPAPTRARIPIPGITDRNLASPINIAFSPEQIQLSTAPQFYAFNTIVPPMGDNITWVYFNPTTDAGNRVYWDGIVLVPGDYTQVGPPEFDDEDASSGTWGGEPFTNIIRNASGESSWPVFAGWLRKLLPARVFLRASDILSVFDIKATGLYFQYTGERLFRTFWAVFGWANVPMYGQKPYRFFFLSSFIYSIGFIVGLIRKKFDLSWQVFLIIGTAVVLQVTMVVYRGIGSWFSTTYFPVARYIYPAILPIGILLMGGADQLIHLVHKTTQTTKAVLYGAFISLQLGIILWAIISISIFYHGL